MRIGADMPLTGDTNGQQICAPSFRAQSAKRRFLAATRNDNQQGNPELFSRNCLPVVRALGIQGLRWFCVEGCGMKVETYLLFNGECREAIEFYHSVLGGTILTMMAHRGSPAEAQFVPEDWLGQDSAHTTGDRRLVRLMALGRAARSTVRRRWCGFNVSDHSQDERMRTGSMRH